MKHRTVEEGRALVAEFSASGKTAQAFVRESGCSLHTLQYWKQRVKALDVSSSAPKRFVEVSRSAATASAMSIQAGIVQVSFAVLPGAAWLSEFVAALNGR